LIPNKNYLIGDRMAKNKSNEKFIEECKLIHGDKFDYSQVDYKNAHTKVKIICKKHGIFEQSPRSQLKGSGCFKCSLERLHKSRIESLENIIYKFKKIHGNKYIYDLVEYKNTRTKVKIICRIHGTFEQKPYHHLMGCGCQKCNVSKGERKILNYLIEKEISYIQEYKELSCKYKKLLKFDFAVFIGNEKIFIEYNGEQHYIPVAFGCKDKQRLQEIFAIIQYRDTIKENWCRDNDIPLIIIPYTDFNNIEKILDEKLKI
jgi:hypothetical protein